MASRIFSVMKRIGNWKVILLFGLINFALLLWVSTYSNRRIIDNYLISTNRRLARLALEFSTNNSSFSNNLLSSTSRHRNDSAYIVLQGVIRTQNKIESKSLIAGSKMCPDILVGMSRGRWITRNLSSTEQEKVHKYLREERGGFNIPPTFQRVDGRCGDVPYEGSPLYNHMWFKAICNSNGTTPCCRHNICVDLSEEQCQCSECYDERSKIHAEYGKWQPDNDACAIQNHSTTEACRLLKGFTISFIGDSFVRHVFAALVILLTGNTLDGALKENVQHHKRTRCTGWHQVTGLTCRDLLSEKRSLCDETVQVDYTEVFQARQLPDAIPVLQSHSQNTQKSLIVVGLGIHNDFRIDDITKVFLKPLLNIHQFWQREPKNIGSVVGGLKSFKTDINIDYGIILDSIIKRNDDFYFRDIIKRHLYNDFLNNYHSYINFTFDPSDIQKMESKINASFSNSTSNVTTSNTSIHSLQDHNTNYNKTILLNASPIDAVFKYNSSKATIHSKSKKLLWMGSHAPGLLKSPKFSRQTHDGVLAYNREIYKELDQWGVPYLDTFGVTKEVVSFDGTHYGWGVNMLKANMLLTYIQEKLKPDFRNWNVS